MPAPTMATPSAFVPVGINGLKVRVRRSIAWTPAAPGSAMYSVLPSGVIARSIGPVPVIVPATTGIGGPAVFVATSIGCSELVPAVGTHAVLLSGVNAIRIGLALPDSGIVAATVFVAVSMTVTLAALELLT